MISYDLLRLRLYIYDETSIVMLKLKSSMARLFNQTI
jgi:hypothetical protein